MIVQALGVMAVLSLGAADSFSILGGSGVSATGTMRVTGNVGAGTGGVRGVSPAVGEILPAGDALRDVTAALNDLASGPCVTRALSGTIAPGVYCASSIGDSLILDGNADAVWIFRVDDPLTTPPASSMRLINGAKSSHVFWAVNGAAILGERSSFIGTLIALTSITVREGVTVSGRLIARQGTVTLTTDDVNFCCYPLTLTTLPNGVANKSYSSKIAGSGGTSPFTFSLFSGTLPPGLGPLGSDGTLSGIPTAPGSYTFIVMAEDYKGCTSIQTYTLVICDTTTVVPSTLPDAVAGSAYSVLITTTSGTQHVFTTTPLPDVMTLIPASCTPEALLCGTPQKAGTYKFTITASDCQNGCSGSREYTLKVVCPAITVFPSTLDAGTVGIVYQKVLNASGSLEPYTFTAEPSIPPGVTVDSSGLLSFTPDKPGDYSIKVQATDSHGCSGTRDYTINVCPAITITPESLPTDVTSVQLGADPPGSYEFSAPDRPTSVTLSTGFLDWSNTPPGDYTFAVIATHESCSGSRVYKLHVPEPFICPVITVSPTTLSRGTVLVPYSKVITIAGGSPPYTVTPTTAGPLTLSPTTTQNGIVTLAGIPTTTGIITFTLTATDSNGCSGMQTYHIAIDPPLVPGPVIPTLSEWMLAILAMVLAGAGFVLTRKGGAT